MNDIRSATEVHSMKLDQFTSVSSILINRFREDGVGDSYPLTPADLRPTIYQFADQVLAYDQAS